MTAGNYLSKEYAMKEKMRKLEDKVEKMRIAMEVLTDVVKILSIKIYGSDEDIEKIYKACERKLEDIT